jgi:hypothetical protein
MNQIPSRVTNWSLKREKRWGVQESNAMLESTRGPSIKPACAATSYIAASVMSVEMTSEAATELSLPKITP